MAKFKNVSSNTVCIDHKGNPAAYPAGKIFDANPRHADVKHLVKIHKIIPLPHLDEIEEKRKRVATEKVAAETKKAEKAKAKAPKEEKSGNKDK